MLAECAGAVIGVDTHRDTHHAEIARPGGAVIAACSIPNTSAGHAQLLAWACQHAPRLRLGLSPREPGLSRQRHLSDARALAREVPLDASMFVKGRRAVSLSA